MAPSGRSLRRELKALLEDQAVLLACQSKRQGRREPKEVPKENSQVIDSDGGDSPDLGFFQREMGSELQNMLERFKGDMTKVLRTKRKRFVTETNAALRVINEKIGNAAKKRQELRQKFYQEYFKQFLTLLCECNRDAQKTREEEEKLTILFHKQLRRFQQARAVQSQRLKQVKKCYDQFLKDVEYLEKNQEYLLTNEAKEFRKELAKLQSKIVVDVQQQELANIRNSLQYLLL